MTDPRPKNCRFRRRDEGKPYPRSSCSSCGATIATGLGGECNYGGGDQDVVDDGKRANGMSTFHGLKIIRVDRGTVIKCSGHESMVVDENSVVSGDGMIWMTPGMFAKLERNARDAQAHG